MELIVDGRTIKAREGQSVLEAARAYGIHIPTLCYHEGLEPFGGCRLCVVEMIGGGPPGLHSSCTLPATPGLELQSASERVLRARRLVVELLLARAPEVPAIRQLAAQFGVEQTDLTPRDERCILCGRCVRVCAQLGVHAIGFAFRSTDRRVTVPFDRTSEVCIACRACFHICPTEAIEAMVTDERVRVSAPGPREEAATELERVACSRCGRPWVPQRAWDLVQRKQPEHLRREELLCPSCRRKEQILRAQGVAVNGE